MALYYSIRLNLFRLVVFSVPHRASSCILLVAASSTI